jgi:hypothetical protein
MRNFAQARPGVVACPFTGLHQSLECLNRSNRLVIGTHLAVVALKLRLEVIAQSGMPVCLYLGSVRMP